MEIFKKFYVHNDNTIDITSLDGPIVILGEIDKIKALKAQSEIFIEDFTESHINKTTLHNMLLHKADIVVAVDNRVDIMTNIDSNCSDQIAAVLERDTYLFELLEDIKELAKKNNLKTKIHIVIDFNIIKTNKLGFIMLTQSADTPFVFHITHDAAAALKEEIKEYKESIEQISEDKVEGFTNRDISDIADEILSQVHDRR